MANSYLKGQTIKIEGRFSENGTAVDPAIVYVRTLNPANIAVDHAYGALPNDVTKVAAGHYRYDLLLDVSGTWTYRVEGAGTHVTAMEGVVTAHAPAWALW
uniref:YtkA-like domain-containing protein n=1 Tax=viral metagenome TaxID=1070528 RepID=A0A6M3MBR5_9ZZZZ